MSTGDGFRRNPFEDFDDGSDSSTHRSGRTFSDKTFGAKWRQMVANQREQSFLATCVRFITSD